VYNKNKDNLIERLIQLMKLYFDMNIYNRIFDDQNQIRIRFETMAINIIFELIEKGKYNIYWSFMLEDENNKNPYINRKSYIKLLSNICKDVIVPDNQIKILAQNIIDNSNAKIKDALHIACATFGSCEYFITCDDKLIKTIISNKKNLHKLIRNVKILNPVDFLREEMNVDVIG
jgi:predicted nucleic acid-binding protein